MTDEDRAVAARRAAPRSTRPAATARRTGCGSSRTTPATTTATTTSREPDALVPPARPLGPRRSAELGHGRTTRGRGYRRGQRGVRRRRGRGARRRSPTRAVWFHDYHLYLAPRSSATRGRTRRSRTSSTSRGRSPTTGACCPRRCARIHDGLLANDVVGFHTRAGGRTSSRSAEDPRCRGRPRRALWSHGGRRRVVTAHPISVDTGEFDELAASDGGRSRRSAICEPPARAADPARRPHRPVEEHRARLPRLRAATSTPIPRRTGASCMLALLDPSRQDIPEYAEYLRERPARPAQSTTGSRREGWSRSTLRDRGRLPPVGRRVQAVRRAARERDLRRAQPRRQGGAARERARRRARPLRERGRARGARRTWAVTVNPFDVAGQAEALHVALELPDEERAPAAEAIRAHVREHDLDGVARASSSADLRPRGLPDDSGTSRASASPWPMSDLSHVDESGDVRMVDVGGKPLSRRRAVAARPCAWRPRPRAGCASCRRATRSRPRSSPGSWPPSRRPT